MTGRNALEIKEKILLILKRRGPSLPVHVTKETGLSILFASAFLSELVADRLIKYTDMKVGSSPIYFLNEQAYMLERFSQYLNNREKEAFILLREKKFLKDEEQTPVIRVALREIKDFAIPFNKDGKTIWRYYLVPESEFSQSIQEITPEIQVKPTKEIKETKETKEEEVEEKAIEVILEKPKETKKESQKELNILDKQSSQKKVKVKETKEKSKPKTKKKEKKKTTKNDENFFNKVKEWIAKNSMEILDIESFNKNELRLKIKNNGEELLLVAYNKKRVTDSDLIKNSKKAKEVGLKYMVISMGETQKKITDLIDAARNLSEIKKID